MYIILNNKQNAYIIFLDNIYQVCQ